MQKVHLAEAGGMRKVDVGENRQSAAQRENEGVAL